MFAVFRVAESSISSDQHVHVYGQVRPYKKGKVTVEASLMLLTMAPTISLIYGEYRASWAMTHASL